MTEQNNDTVYILDSYGLIFRCYFAFISRPLTNSKGENVSALFGFFRNLHWILQHYKPDYIFAAMDSKTKTFRHEKYEAYKANRNKTPDDLHAQIPWIEEILKDLGIPVLQCDGYEADDIIATVAKKCEKAGRNCRILSGDKDLMQLVTENTKILKPESGASTWKLTGTEGVEAEWGVKPAKLLDLLALYGDSADNIPGVNGIGVKTAAKLIGDYNDLDGIYAHLDEIKGAMQKKLIDGKESAYFSKELVRLCDTVPCEQIDAALCTPPLQFNYSLAAQKMFEYGVPNVAKNYAELGGYSLLTKKNNESSTTNSKEPKTDFTAVTDEPVINLVQNDTSSYKALTTLKELEDYISAFLAGDLSKTPVAYDSETTSLDTITTDIVGFSLAFEKGKAVYVPLQKESEDLFCQTDYILPEQALNQLLRIFTNPKVSVIMHNAKFDLKVLICNLKKHLKDGNVLSKLSDSPFSLICCQILDTMILAWLINPERTGKNGYSLEYLGETMLGLKGIEFTDIVEKGQTFADVTLDKALPYAAEDADFTLQLMAKLKEKDTYSSFEKDYALKENSLYKMEMQILPVLTQMELNGIHLDCPSLNSYNKELTEGLIQAEQEIQKAVGHEFNIASPKQLQTVLFDELKLPKGKKTKTGYSTDTSVLEELAQLNPVPKLILEYRELAKLQSTYVQTLPQLADSQSRIHTDFIQTGTATGRLSCREPNLQNIPVRSEAGRKIRQAFTAPEGKVLISADYAQIELVVLAHLSKDENMCNAFNSGTDVHKATAAIIYSVKPDEVTDQMRRTAKTINFGVIYGMSAFRLAQDLGISRTQASMFIDNYFKLYSKVNSFIHQTVIDAEDKGYVETIFGRRRPILNINSKNKIEKSAAERIAVNSPVQGSAADIVKKAMLEVQKELIATSSKAKLLLQVHDELIFECPDESSEIEKTISLIKAKMEGAVKLTVPLKVSIEYGKNWGEFH